MMRRSASDFRKIDCVFSLTGGEHVLPIPYLSKRALDIGAPIRHLGCIVGILHLERDQSGEAGTSSQRPGHRTAGD